MSKLEQLLADLCPDGVGFKTLGEIATDMYRGAGIKREEVSDDGEPCVRYGEIYTTYGIWFDTCVSQTNAGTKTFGHGDILFAITGERVDEIAKSCAYIGHETCYAGGDIVVMKHEQNPKYLSYALSTVAAQKQKSEGKVKSKVVHSSVPALKAIRIPLPPLPVQSEIVRILDSFAELTAELTTELTAELTARKKQYEYYRDLLLSYDGYDCTLGEECDTITDYVAAGSFADLRNKVQYKSSEDYAQLVRTTDIKSNFTRSDFVYVTESAFKFLWRVNLNTAAIILPNIGVNCGEVYYVAPDTLPYENNVLGPNAILVRSSKHNNKYLSYLFQTPLFQKQLQIIISPGGQTKFNKTELKKLQFPLPPRPEQDRIVSILDQFEELASDLTTGLPAEIEARQKQYEYYRDMLLTFKEVS